MVKQIVILFTTFAMLFSVHPVTAQQAGKVYRVGLLSPGSVRTHGGFLESLRQGMRDAGYMESRDIFIEARWALGRKQLSALAVDLVQNKADVNVVIGIAAARAAKKASKTIPIVVALGSDLVGSGLVRSLAKPGGNVTGLTTLSLELSAKRLELLKNAIPKLSRVAILFNPVKSALEGVKRAKIAASGLKINIQAVPVKARQEIETAFKMITKEHAEALILIVSRFVDVHRTQLIELAKKSKIPAMCWSPSMARAGCLMSYGADRFDMVRRAATYVDKILKGANPADLPVELPTKYDLVVNLKTAKTLGITFPPSILLRADEVIE